MFHTYAENSSSRIRAKAQIFGGSPRLGPEPAPDKSPRSPIETYSEPPFSPTGQGQSIRSWGSALVVNASRIANPSAAADVVGNCIQSLSGKWHDFVAILFVDIVGFTALSSSVAADRLVQYLDLLFGNFDEVCPLHCYFVLRLQSSHRCLFQPTVIVPHAPWEAYGRGSFPLHNLVSDSGNPHYVSDPLPRHCGIIVALDSSEP